jgi:hypothetical protein
MGYMAKDQLLNNDIETFEVMFSNRELAAYKQQKQSYPNS